MAFDSTPSAADEVAQIFAPVLQAATLDWVDAYANLVEHRDSMADHFAAFDSAITEAAKGL